MFRFITSLVIAVIYAGMFSCSKSPQESGNENKNKDTTRFVRYFEHSKQVEEEVGLKNHRYHGLYKLYYKDGNIKVLAFYKKGFLEGVQKSYYSTGKIKAIEKYIRDKKDSICTYFNEDGSLMKTIQYQDGKMHGAFRTFYPEGKPYQKYTYRYGKKDGKQIAYYPNGKMMFSAESKYGLPAIGLKEYDKNGKLKEYGYTIISQEENKLRLAGVYTYRFKLNKPAKAVSFHVGELDAGKFISFGQPQLKAVNGWYEVEFYIPEGKVYIKTLVINAMIILENSRQLVISKKYNVALSN